MGEKIRFPDLGLLDPLGTPVVVSGEEVCGQVGLGLLGGELVGERLAGRWVCSWSVRLEFGIGRGLQPVCLALVPLGPALRLDVRAHLGVEEDDGGFVAPWESEVDLAGTGVGGQAAVVEDVTGVLAGLTALGGEVAASGMGNGVNLAVFEGGLGVAEDEVDFSLDVAVLEELAGGVAGGLLAGFGAGHQGVLLAEEADVAQDGAVGGDGEGNGLGAGTAGLAPVVGDGEVLGVEVVAGDEDCRGTGGSAGVGGAVVVDDDDFGRIFVDAAQLDVGAVDVDDLAVDAGADADDGTFGRGGLDGLVDGAEVGHGAGVFSADGEGDGGGGEAGAGLG